MKMRHIGIAAAVVGGLIVLLALIPHTPTAPCAMPGHARTTTLECGR